jgi:hypothetical protein
MVNYRGASAPVSVVEVSRNEKTGPVSATYAPQSTCPSTCPLRGNGCYAESGPAGATTARVNLNSEGASITELARIEAEGIRSLSGKLPLRIHVVGDANTDECASIIAEAAEDHTRKFGQPVWTYTHAWRTVRRESWGNVSVLASCESPAQAREAMARGYAASIVTSSHDGASVTFKDGVKVLPCPQQTGTKNNCAGCQLCFKGETLLRHRIVIGFAVHGIQKTRALNVIASYHAIEAAHQ